MKHVFILHSNITALCASNYIKHFSPSNILILTRRGYIWPFEKDLYTIIDISHIEEEMDISYKSSCTFIDRYRKRVDKEDMLIKQTRLLVNEEDFLLYTPHLDIILARNFIENPFCNGFYYLEEGLMSYTPIKTLKKRYFKQWRKIVFYYFMGWKFYFYYYSKTNKFLGSIGLTEEAFSWNKKEKIVLKLKQSSEKIDKKIKYLIVCGYLEEDINDINKCIKIVIDNIHSENKEEIALKLHPQSFFNNREKTDVLTNRWSGILKVLPSDFIAEELLLSCTPVVFNICEFSSLSMYALKFGCKLYLIDNKSFILQKYNT